MEADRVRQNTAPHVNRKIDSASAHNIRRYVNRSQKTIYERIKYLGHEWDIERVLETNAATLALAGLVLGTSVNRKWLALSGVVIGFLLLHGLEGWCPPIPLLRRAGVRTRSEIDREILVLNYLRNNPGELRGAAKPERPLRERRRLGALVGSGA